MNARISIAALALLAGALACSQSHAQGKDIRVGFIVDKTGPLEAYMKQTQTGFQIGLEYATGGTMAVAGRKIFRDCA